MKKISFLIYSLGSGGAERIVSYLLKYFSQKYEIYLVLMNDTIFYEIPENVKVFFLEKSKPYESGFKKFLKIPYLGLKYRNFLIRKKIDISISFMNRPNYINIFSKLIRSNTRTIISERITSLKEYSGYSFRNLLSKSLIKILYRFSDYIIPNSKGIANDLINYFSVNLEKVKVIYNFVVNDNIAKQINKRNDLKKKNFIFVNIGRLEPQKNHYLLLEAIHKLKSMDIKLIIIGEGPLKKYLKEQIKILKLEDKVELLGRQKNPYKFLANADCFVFSSKYEGFPNVILEALACGLPVISTDCRSGPREILAPDTDFRYETKDIEFAKYGALVPVEDVEKMAEAMKIIYENKELRDKYKQKAINRAKDFDVKKIIKQWEEIIDG